MATLEDAYLIVSELTAKLHMPQPHVTVSPPKFAFHSAPAFLGNDGLRVSPEVLSRLDVGQLRICFAYALAGSRVAKKSANIVKGLALAVILPLGTIYSFTTGGGSSGLPGWFGLTAVIAVALYLCATYPVYLWTTRQTDSEVFRITNDLPGIRKCLLAGGYYKKGDTPVVPKPRSVDKRMEMLQRK